MRGTNSFSRIHRQWLAGTIAALLALLLGVGFLFFSIGGGVTRLSYDLLFALRGKFQVQDLVVVYMDEESHAALKQPMLANWDRSLHARLVDRLSEAGAKAIVFDILFTEPSSEPLADAQFVNAIRNSRRVILGGNLRPGQWATQASGGGEELPYEPLRAGAAGWGNVNFLEDPDYGIRQFFPNFEDLSGQSDIPWLPSAVARFLQPKGTPARKTTEREPYLNYFGPPGWLPSVSYSQALSPQGTSPGFFKNRIVFIGSMLSADFSGKGKDEFRTPYALWGHGFAPGVEIHATATLNLLQGNWLIRLPLILESALMVLTALVSGYALMRFPALQATLLAIAGFLTVALLAKVLVWQEFLWFAWLIPVLQIGTALFCSVVFNSFALYVEKRLLEQSLAAHLSPEVVKKLMDDPALRHPGGSQQEVSILFSDTANFSGISSRLLSDDLVRLVNKYYETALQCIHQQQGTIISLLGDAIFAIWNAPVPQVDHRERACRAALRLREELEKFSAGEFNLPFRTRIGLHAGTACVGNIGSSAHFEYTALGENTNLCSRLEGLNKYLGTGVLVTREVQHVVENAMAWRQVGHFRLKGLTRIVEVYELIGPLDQAETSRPWRDEFSAALQEFRRRHFDTAAQRFRRASKLRGTAEPTVIPVNCTGPGDGPSQFYLEAIEALRRRPPGPDWLGEVELGEK